MGSDKKSNPAPPSYETTVDAPRRRAHTNAVIAAGNLRSRDEQDMQNHLQKLQFDMGIFNSDIEPEHDSDWICSCPIHIYKQRKINRLPVQNEWSKAVMYPGEKSYHDCYQYSPMFSSNPYQFISAYTNPGGFRGSGGFSATSVYGVSGFYGVARPDPYNYTRALEKTLRLNTDLNRAAQISVDQKEPKVNIWAPIQPEVSPSGKDTGSPLPDSSSNEKSAKSSKLSGLRRAFSIKSSEERAAERTAKAVAHAEGLRNAILHEENGRWPDESWRRLVAEYQEHVGMTRKIADLRARCPLQYLHLLRAGYFEPIPVDWANLASNPLKFSIEAASGWRGITPAWRGYEDTAEERLYWVLNHREGVTGPRMKPDPISAMQLARARMASAVEPPPAYFSPDDTCNVQHKSDGYSKQVMPAPFRPFDAPVPIATDTPGRGVALSFPFLELYGVELLEILHLAITVKCERCKESMDIKNVPNITDPKNAPKTESCKKCANSMSIGFRKQLMHSHANRAGYLDLDGCTIVDLLPSNFIPTCSECSTPYHAPGVSAVRGESAMAICRHCHRKMVFKVPEVKFLLVGSAAISSRSGLSLKRKPKEVLGIVAGQELPRRGRCQHYSKSYRWFRFGCCAKVFPCDRCHDAETDHPNEHANRMICGFCSREQVYRPENCGICKAVLIGKAGRGFWEGGKGTRNPALMSRKDPRKYKRRGANPPGGSSKKK